ncbi:MAG: hypothetical protein WBA22_09630 [Candidatus Methanofastidiosia archaeon]
MDRREEHGVDLEIWRKGETEKYLYSIKKKPEKRDLNQLKELESREENNKVYIYVKKPSVAFKDEMEKARGIRFWGSGKLTKEIFSRSPYLAGNIWLSSHRFERELYTFTGEIKYKDFKAIKKAGIGIVLSELDKRDLPYIVWRLKDDATALHKSFRSLALFFANASFLDNIRSSDAESLFLSYISLVDQLHEIQNHFKFTFAELLHLDINLIGSVMRKTHSNSHWLPIFGYRPIFTPGGVIETIKSEKTNTV